MPQVGVPTRSAQSKAALCCLPWRIWGWVGREPTSDDIQHCCQRSSGPDQQTSKHHQRASWQTGCGSLGLLLVGDRNIMWH